jgi:hypothetical protein
MTNTTQPLPSAFTRVGAGKWHMNLLCTSWEFQIMFEAMLPLLHGHVHVKLAWDRLDDVEFGRVFLEVWMDYTEEALAVALRAYDEINGA